MNNIEDKIELKSQIAKGNYIRSRKELLGKYNLNKQKKMKAH